ncbi:MAG: ABC transporter substrate-binding protein, partial [Chloroflexota bacterium]
MKRGFTLLLVVLAMLFAFSAASAQDPTTFNGGWPYQPPPTGHFNQFAANNIIALGAYYPLMNPPLAVYHWDTGEYEGYLADTLGFDADNNYVVTLKPGLKWSDGSAVTSADVVTTFEVQYLLNNVVWKSMSKVEAVDDLTVKFTLTGPSKLVERQIVAQVNIGANSVYGDIAKMADPLITAAKTSDDDGFKAALQALTDLRPAAPVASGPYVLDPASITAQNLTLVKNVGGLHAADVKFDQVRLWNGETEAVTPLVSNGDLWYGTYGFPPATEKAFIDAGLDIIRGPFHSGPAIYFNYKVYPFDKVEFRQAVAYIIDRDQNGSVSLGQSGLAVGYMTGIGDSLVDSWVADDVKAKLNTYDVDLDKATELLTGIGFTKGSDGKWLDDKGAPLAFTLEFPSDYTDWSAAAENALEQLNAFGFDITGNAVVSTQEEPDVYNSNFQMAIRNWGASSPFPGISWLEPFQRYNGQGLSAGQQVGGGINFNNDVTYSGGELNLLDATIKSGQGLDVDAQKAIIDQIALAYNELLPAIPLWERLGNNPLNRKFVNAPASDDPIYLNPSSGTDS